MTIVYEDQLVTVTLAPDPATHGHLLIQPRKEVKHLGQLLSAESAHLFQVASYTAAILFQGLKAEGTNIITNEEEGRLTLHVIARRNEDGLALKWEPKQLSESEMNESEERLKEKTPLPGEQKKEGAAEKKEKSDASKDEVISEAEDEENYLIKQLIRIP